jgi:activator of 2-hydroxyglutaryl-CoA dehydratase
LEDELKSEVVIPEHPELMGAIGAALLAGRQTPG